MVWMKNHALMTVSTAKDTCPSFNDNTLGMCANCTTMATTHINRLNTTKARMIHLPMSCSCARRKIWLLLVCHNFGKVNSKYSHTDTFQANSKRVLPCQSVASAKTTNNTAVSSRLMKK